MSGGAIRRAGLSRIEGLQAPDGLKSMLSEVVQSCHGDFLELVYEAGRDAGLSDHGTCARGMAILFQYGAIQVCDDICDGDASYLPDVQRDGPIVLMMLQQAYLDALADARTGAETLERAARHLCCVGSGQYEELRTRRWTLARALNTACGLNGEQYAAYFTLLWTGTPLGPRAVSVGLDLGMLVHVSTDLLTGDPRFHSLRVSERIQLLQRARAAGIRLGQTAIRSVTRVAATALPQLDQALDALRTSRRRTRIDRDCRLKSSRR